MAAIFEIAGTTSIIDSFLDTPPTAVVAGTLITAAFLVDVGRAAVGGVVAGGGTAGLCRRPVVARAVHRRRRLGNPVVAVETGTRFWDRWRRSRLALAVWYW